VEVADQLEAVTVRRLGNQRHIGFNVNKGAKPLSQNGVIIDGQNPNRSYKNIHARSKISGAITIATTATSVKRRR
jgi:hypothetical protein